MEAATNLGHAYEKRSCHGELRKTRRLVSGYSYRGERERERDRGWEGGREEGGRRE